jgi:hypothetical protein
VGGAPLDAAGGRRELTGGARRGVHRFDAAGGDPRAAVTRAWC